MKNLDLELIEELEQKFAKLVWYADTDAPTDDTPTEAADIYNSVLCEFPDETAELIEDDRNADVAHGFNCGLLAGMRMLKDMLAGEDPMVDFPNLGVELRPVIEPAPTGTPIH